VTWLVVVSLVIGVAGAAAAAWFYYHLWKWARDCQQATVAIAYKRKVVMSPTLVELLLWSRKVPEGQGGQVFYRASNVTVAIVKREKRGRKTRRQIEKNAQPPRAQVQQGTWAKEDASVDAS
jgi:hypothetical protein